MAAHLDTSAVAGTIHDAQLDYYGKRIAAAASDHAVHVWDISDGNQRPAGVLKGHEGPVWKTAWAHPKFGSLLATCSYDMKVIIWKEMPAFSSTWHVAYVDSSHTASVNDIQFCPWEHGLRLACASSDGTVSVLTYGPDCQWRRDSFKAHAGGAECISWMPMAPQQMDGRPPMMRLATGGCDSSVAVWRCCGDGEVWMPEMPPFPPVHSDWVRSVAWRPEGNAGCIMASGSWDKTVVVWQQMMEGQPWRQKAKLVVEGKVERVAWSVTGSILAVSHGDGDTVLYRETVDGGYVDVGTADESGLTEIQVDPKLLSSSAPGGPADNISYTAAGVAPAAAAAPSMTTEQQQQQQNVLEAFGF